MVRVGGLRYSIDPRAKIGARISRMTLGDKPIDAAKKYKVAGWAPVAEEAKLAGGEPIWDVMKRYLKSRKTIAPRTAYVPRIEGAANNPGMG